MTQIEPSATPMLFDALARLADRLEGELRIDPLHRMMYATDASMYVGAPIAVAFPRHRQDIVEIVRVAHSFQIPLVPRTAGTSLSGQTVGQGIVVDVSRHMTRILEIDVERRTARVEPGVILDELNRALAPHGLVFGPDTSTSSRCMIGGMIGNNSCGSHSILYGNTLAHVLELDAVLTDGSEVHFGPCSARELAAKRRLATAEGAIYDGLAQIVSRHRDEILDRYPKPEVTRRNMGYALDYLARSAPFEANGESWNLAKFLCGSEGTLAFTTSATLNLEPAPKESGLVAVHFEDLYLSLEATVVAVGHNPSAVELMDRRILEVTRDNLEQARNREWVVGDPGAVLVVEFYRDTREELAAAYEALERDFAARKMGYATVALEGAEAKRVWALRKAGLGLLMGIKGDTKPITFVEDTAVAVADLPEYIRRFSEILERYDTRCVYYAHASVGELHLRPELNPKDPVDLEKMKGIATEVADLVREMRGSISGEHGDGRVRSPFIERMLGPVVTQLLADVKRLWDPLGIMNPRNIVDPKPMDHDLRYRPLGEEPEVETVFAFSEDEGLLRAVERCNGAGACRKLVGSGGTMCPSYMVTRDEKHTTRGRANAFRMLLLGESPAEAMHSEALYEAMDLCLACKGCKAECPASVDMARLKSEFLHHYYKAHGTPLSVRLMGQPELGYRLAQRFSGLANRGSTTWLGRKVLAGLMNVHPARTMPAFAARTLRQQLRGRKPLGTGHRGQVVYMVDVFTDYNEPEIGLAAIELLELAGYSVIIPDLVPTGRPQISKGLLDAARALAIENVERLTPYADAGLPILGVEPSEILTLGDEYPELVPSEMRARARRVGARAQLADVFVGARWREGATDLRGDNAPRKILLHGHCHQKALIGNEPVLTALEAIPGAEVSAIPSGCCGMAGSFGYERDHYEVSMEIGEMVLFPAVRGASNETILAAPGTSCRHQIADGTGRRADHPVKIMRDAVVSP